jgi:plastocyanin
MALGIVGLVCAGPAALGQGGTTPAVKIVDFDFAPKDLTIDVGTTITWTNTGARPHTVTDRGGTFDTNPVAPNASSSIAFTVPGRYSYFCRINPGRMNGTLTVRAAGPANVVRVQAIDPARENESLRFDPAELDVTTGSTILLANVGGKPHTLTADTDKDNKVAFDSGVIAPGAEGGRFAGTNATIAITKPGTFPFHCEIHPLAMKGVLRVTGTEKKTAGAASAAAQTASVDVADFAFKPDQISVAPGGKVTWRNRGSAPHTATFDDVALDTGTMRPGTEGQLAAPDKPGSYSYRCTIHPAKMRGVLVVVGQNIADPTKGPEAKPAQPAGGGGPGGGVSALALATGVAGAFLGGFGVSAFVRTGMGIRTPA